MSDAATSPGGRYRERLDPSESTDIRARAAGVLGVEPTCGEAELRRLYRELALIHHPDRGGDPHFMAVLTEAYQTMLVTPSPVAEASSSTVDDWGQEGSERIGVSGTLRLVMSVVVLPAVALGLVALALWFIRSIS